MQQCCDTFGLCFGEPFTHISEEAHQLIDVGKACPRDDLPKDKDGLEGGLPRAYDLPARR